MTPPVSFTKTTLSYPIFAADFDPYNRGYLVVAGGGGEGRSGVGNKITLLDVSSRSTIKTASEIELSRDEDSVMSLATLGSKNGLIAYAGINSSEEAMKEGNNQHFRSFQVSYPSQPNADGSAGRNLPAKIKPLGKTSVFSASTTEGAARPECYQRLLRLSPARLTSEPTKRIGAIATGLASGPSEIVVFNAGATLPNQASDIITRITPPDGVEAGDLDIANVEAPASETPKKKKGAAATFALAYSDNYNIYTSHLEPWKGKTPEPRPVYSVAHPDVFEGGPANRAKLRALRFLGPNFVVALENRQQKKRAEVVVLQLPTGGIGSAQEVSRVKLPAHMKVGVGLDAVALDVSPRNGAQQFVIAAAGQDGSVGVWVIDFNGKEMGRLWKYNIFRNVLPAPITSVVFSPFHAPEKGNQKGTRKQQYLRLATTSSYNAVSVDTLPLSFFRDRHKLAPASTALTKGAGVFTAIVVFLVSILLAQSYLDATAPAGGKPKIDMLPAGVRDVLGQLKGLDLAPPGEIADQMRRRAAEARGVAGEVAGAVKQGVQQRVNEFAQGQQSREATTPESAGSNDVSEEEVDPNVETVIELEVEEVTETETITGTTTIVETMTVVEADDAKDEL